MKRFCFIVLSTLLAFIKSEAQVYIAGSILTSYADINPDTLINYQGLSSSENYYLDINNDAQDDFRIYAYSLLSMTSYGGSIEVYPLNSNSFCRLKRIDSVYITSQSYWWVTKVALPLIAGDTINQTNASWDNSNQMLTCQRTSFGTTKNITDWISSSDQYIGIKYQALSDTIYGWIRVNIPSQNNCHLKDYSVGLNSIGIIKHELPDYLKAYPNPSTGKVSLLFENGYLPKNKKGVIYDSNSRAVMEFEINSAEASSIISTDALPNGIYIIKIQDHDRLFVKRLVIAK